MHSALARAQYLYFSAEAPQDFLHEFRFWSNFRILPWGRYPSYRNATQNEPYQVASISLVISSNSLSVSLFSCGASLLKKIIENDATTNPGTSSYKSNNPPSKFDQTITVIDPANILMTADLAVMILKKREKTITGPNAEPNPAQA